MNAVGDLDAAVRAVDKKTAALILCGWGTTSCPDPFDIKQTPALAIYTTEVIKSMVTWEGFGMDDVPDLFFINWKPIDLVGHKWNMLSPEGESVLRHSDRKLGEAGCFPKRPRGQR